MVGDVARNIPRINAALEDRQTDFQPTMIELEGTLLTKPVSILVDPGASLSYVSLKLVEMCKLKEQKFKNSWLVQLATGAKRKVTTKVPNCVLEVAEQQIEVDLNILPLGSYDVLLGMDWLEKHWTVVDCKEKTITFRKQDGTRTVVQGVKKPVQLRPITASQLGASPVSRAPYRMSVPELTELKIQLQELLDKG